MKNHYKKSKDFFNKVGLEKKGYFDSPISSAYFFQEKIKKKALKWVKNYHPKKILDAACGRGDFSMKLADYFKEAEVLGVDFSEEMIKLARQSYNINNLKFDQADLLKLPFEDKFFDISFCLATFHHIHPDDFKQFISEITRVTKGAVIFDFRNQKTIFWNLYYFLFKKKNPELNCYGTKQETIRLFFEEEGFLIEKNSPIFIFSIFSPAVLVKFRAKNI